MEFYLLGHSSSEIDLTVGTLISEQTDMLNESRFCPTHIHMFPMLAFCSFFILQHVSFVVFVLNFPVFLNCHGLFLSATVE